ncbi:CRE-TRE-3 protein [Caenorhabditis remanei]|uniref:Trehalase n=1 Tax=Caenorhabditis remanei TaxID=31234 RepID=E3LPP9_CAERE|nr:CRE-TRE-3 protein [Caenorhabditis remanei]
MLFRWFSLVSIVFLCFIPNGSLQVEVHVCDSTNSNNSVPRHCYTYFFNRFIYCNGPILAAVNYHALYNDSKEFVDMPMKQDPLVVSNAWYAKFGNTTAANLNKTDVQAFVNEYFSAAGTELIACTPDDWQEKPPKLATIADPALREWAYKLNGIWKTLCRKIDPAIEQHTSRYSLLYVPNNFIVPGGRFREFYYWDAYWIIKVCKASRVSVFIKLFQGLIACEMYNTTKSMIRNLATMVDQHGFVPNGGRVYYLQRSQPPLLSAMVYELYEATNDKDFIAELLPTLLKELNFWNEKRTVKVNLNGKEFEVYQYKTPSNVPRPESYRVDTVNSAKLANGMDKQQFYQDLASAAESGWDFSTRWFSDYKSLTTIETTKVLPVDLNGLLCWNMDIMEYLYEQVGDTTNSQIFRNRRAVFRDTVQNVFYNRTDGTWYDFNLRTQSHNPRFYTSTAVPLFTNCYNTLNTGKSQKVFDYMSVSKMGDFNYPGGIPSSMSQESTEQWDFPNGWSPNNHMIIEGLRKSANPEMQDQIRKKKVLRPFYERKNTCDEWSHRTKVSKFSLGTDDGVNEFFFQGFLIASKWVMGNFRVFYETGHMWEKYNVIGSYPQPGSGGEYDVQDGFGWTNGAILDLLLTYNDRLFVPDNFINATTASPVQTTTKVALTQLQNSWVVLFAILIYQLF